MKIDFTIQARDGQLFVSAPKLGAETQILDLFAAVKEKGIYSLAAYGKDAIELKEMYERGDEDIAHIDFEFIEVFPENDFDPEFSFNALNVIVDITYYKNRKHLPYLMSMIDKIYLSLDVPMYSEYSEEDKISFEHKLISSRYFRAVGINGQSLSARKRQLKRISYIYKGISFIQTVVLLIGVIFFWIIITLFNLHVLVNLLIFIVFMVILIVLAPLISVWPTVFILRNFFLHVLLKVYFSQHYDKWYGKAIEKLLD